MEGKDPTKKKIKKKQKNKKEKKEKKGPFRLDIENQPMNKVFLLSSADEQHHLLCLIKAVYLNTSSPADPAQQPSGDVMQKYYEKKYRLFSLFDEGI